MYWIVILDYGNRRELYPVHSSEFAANLIANNWKAIAKARGDRIKVKSGGTMQKTMQSIKRGWHL